MHPVAAVQGNGVAPQLQAGQGSDSSSESMAATAAVPVPVCCALVRVTVCPPSPPHRGLRCGGQGAMPIPLE